MKRLALTTVSLVDMGGKQRCQLPKLLQCLTATALYKNRERREIYSHPFTEGLHRIDDTIPGSFSLEELHRHTSCSMYP